MGVLVTDFFVRLDRDARGVAIVCRGDLDIISTMRFNEALDAALTREPDEVDLDLGAVGHVSAAGVKCLVQAAAQLQERGVAATWRFSPQVRQILDAVGLWWLGVVDDAVSEQQTLGAALRAYARLRFSERWPLAVANEEQPNPA